MRKVFSYHPLLHWGLMEISMNFHGFGGYLCSWRIFVLDTPLKLPYLDTWRPRLISWLMMKAMAGQSTCLKVKAIYHIWKTMCFWRTRLVICPPWFNPLSLSFWSEIFMKQHLICNSLIQIPYILKLINRENEKSAWNQGETASSVGTGKEILLNVKVDYYPLMPLACTSV